MSGFTTNISLNTLCDQRKKQAFFNIPPFRFTPVSPYTGEFTKFQLDMRRKAEILKYSNNTSGTKTNNLTKAQKYAQLISGKANTQTQSFQNNTVTIRDKTGNFSVLTTRWSDKLNLTSTIFTDPSAVQILGTPGYFTYDVSVNYYSPNCAKDRLKPTPTYASGIRGGKIINLIDDETVPLYNYTNESINSASYAVGQNIIDAPWDIYSYQNIQLSSINYNNIASFVVKKAIDKNTYTYSLQIPLGIYFNEIPTSSTLLEIKNVNFSVYYSSTLVNETKISYKFLSNDQTTLSLSINPISIKQITTESGYNYFAIIDTLQIDGIFLYTLPGYTYDFFLALTTNDSALNIVANYDNSYQGAISLVSSSI